MPLPTTFAGESSRGEGQWYKSLGAQPSTAKWLTWRRDMNYSTANSSTSYPYDFIQDVAVDSSGNIYVVGIGSYSGASTTDGVLTNTQSWGFIEKWSTDGTSLWRQTITGPSQRAGQFAGTVKVGASGNVYVAGMTRPWSGNDGANSYVNKYSPTGTILWSQTIVPSPGSSGGTNFHYQAFCYPHCMLLDSSENVYVAVTFENNDNYGNIAMIKYDLSGNVVWQYGNTQNVSASIDHISFDPDGNIFVIGHNNSSTPVGFQFTINTFGILLSSGISLTGNPSGGQTKTAAYASQGAVGTPTANQFGVNDGTYNYAISSDGNGSWHIYPFQKGSNNPAQNSGSTIAKITGVNLLTNAVSFSAGSFIICGSTSSGSPFYANLSYNVTTNTFTKNWEVQISTVGSTPPSGPVMNLAKDSVGNIYVVGGIADGGGYSYSTGSGKNVTYYSYASHDAFLLKWYLTPTAITSNSYYPLIGGTNQSLGISTSTATCTLTNSATSPGAVSPGFSLNSQIPLTNGYYGSGLSGITGFGATATQINVDTTSSSVYNGNNPWWGQYGFIGNMY